MSLTRSRIYQFGEFRLSVSARVLERDGKPLQLGSKAFEVLLCLVTHAGELVTKDELLKTVWPESFVEESNLSQHIFALRRALGDRSTYIVTIAGRGYQFTERVREIAEPEISRSAETGSLLLQRTRERTHITIEETLQAPIEAASRSTPSQQANGVSIQRSAPSDIEVRHDEEPDSGVSLGVNVHVRENLLELPPPAASKRMALGVGIALLAIAMAAGWFAWRGLSHRAVASQRIVLAELDNRTGDAGFDVVLRNALEIDLDQSPFIDVMGEPEALNTLQRMGRSPETALLPAVAREVCVRSNRQVLITGSVAAVGSKYLLTLEASDCDSGRILAGAKAEAASKDQTLGALDAATAKLRHDLGESAESLEHFQVPIAQATTPSLEALKQYSLGEFLLGRMGKEENEALPFFQRALELDPHFVMASAAIATSYQSLGEYQLARPYYQTAFDLSSHVSEKERLYIRAHYYADDKRDIIQGLQAYRMWAEVYPRDWGPWLDMAIEYSSLGQFNAAIAAGEHALSLDPSRGIIYSVLARDYMYVGRYGDAESTATRALSIGKDSSGLDATLFEIALLQNNAAMMASELARGEGKQGEWNLLDLQALASVKDGRPDRAEELFRAAYDAAMSENLQETADGILIDEASAEYDVGMTTAARTTLLRVREKPLSSPEGVVLEAELGDVAFDERVLAAHSSSADSDTLATNVYGPQTGAAIALNQAKPLEAVAELEPAADYDFAAGFTLISERAKAYLMAGEPEKAAFEYKKILDNPGVDPISPLFPLAWLGLARAESQMGHAEQSKADYEKLFGLWSQADADVPVIVSARREYSRQIAARR